MSKPKILQLIIAANIQQFNLFEEVARAFDTSDYDFTFGVLTEEPNSEVVARLHCNTEFFQFKEKQIVGLFPSAIPALYRYIQDNDIEIIIIHRYKLAYMLALLAPFLKKCTRIISVFHGLKEFDRHRRQWLARLFFSEKWRIVGVSQAVVNDLENKKLPKQRLALIRNSIDSKALVEKQLSRNEAREQLGLDPNKLIIGSLGRVKHVKGHDLLFEGFAPLCKLHQHIHLVIMGGGNLEPTLQAISSKHGIEDRITITGMLPNGYRYLPALDIFIMPSRSEGLSIAMLEAMATGIPSIGSNVGGTPEALGEDGIIIPLSISAITESLEKLITESPEQRAAMGAQLQQRINDKLSIGDYHQAYRNLVAKGTSD